MTTSYSITSRSGAASSGAAEAEKHRSRALPHAAALLPVLLLLLVALVAALRDGVGWWAKGESVEVMRLLPPPWTYLRPQRWLPVARKSGPATKARRRDNMLPV